MPRNPISQLWIFAGPNGAGKSTLVARYLRQRLPIVNPDVIAVQIRLPKWAIEANPEDLR